MGICEGLNNDNKSKNGTKRLSNKGKQLYCAPVNDYLCNNNNSTNLGTTMNTISQMDLMSFNEFNKKKPSPLYQYNGTYYKKGEQTSLMTVSLHELQGNSFMNNQAKNSHSNQTKITNSLYSGIDEKDNESSNEFEIISDGKMNENMLQKSTDQTTIDSFNEFIGRKNTNNNTNKHNKDIYYKKKSVNENNDKIKKNEDNKDKESIISGIPSSTTFNKLIYNKN